MIEETKKIDKLDQTGFGQTSSSSEDQEEPSTLADIEKDRALKRKALGNEIFSLMSSPKIKIAKLQYLPKQAKKELLTSLKPSDKLTKITKESTAMNKEGLGSIHKFRKK